jgi:hypothetical protein
MPGNAAKAIIILISIGLFFVPTPDLRPYFQTTTTPPPNSSGFGFMGGGTASIPIAIASLGGNGNAGYYALWSDTETLTYGPLYTSNNVTHITGDLYITGSFLGNITWNNLQQVPAYVRDYTSDIDLKANTTTLSLYYNKSQVDTLISIISLTPGPAGANGSQGPQGNPGINGVNGTNAYNITNNITNNITIQAANNSIFLDAGFNLTNYAGLSSKFTIPYQNITSPPWITTYTETDPSAMKLTGADASNITTGTLTFARLPSLTNTHTLDTINITNWAGANNKITLDSTNITSGTLSLARLPSLTNTHTLDALNITTWSNANNKITLDAANITSGTLPDVRIANSTNFLRTSGFNAANVTAGTLAVARGTGVGASTGTISVMLNNTPYIYAPVIQCGVTGSSCATKGQWMMNCTINQMKWCNGSTWHALT